MTPSHSESPLLESASSEQGPTAPKMPGLLLSDITSGYDFLRRLISKDGAIVSSSACSEMEIAFARSENRFFVDENNMGYVLRPKKWREMAEESITAMVRRQSRE